MTSRVAAATLGILVPMAARYRRLASRKPSKVLPIRGARAAEVLLPFE